MKKIIVTGGSGFIGSNLVKFLLKKNYFVINIDNLSYSANPYNLKEISKNKNYFLSVKNEATRTNTISPTIPPLPNPITNEVVPVNVYYDKENLQKM